VSAEDIKFPPAEKREARRFEVPPWEQDRFEQLREEREAQEAAAAASTRGLPATEEAAGSAEPKAELGPESEREGERVLVPPVSPVPTPVDTTAASGTVPDTKVDEAAMDTMLAQLAVQEETSTRPIETVGLIAAVILTAIGCVLVVWAMAGFVIARRAGFVGVFGGAVLMAFGAGFVAGGIWIGMKNLRQRGVL